VNAVDLIHVVASRKQAWKVEELAELLNCSPRGLYDQIKRGKLPALRIATMVRLNPKITAEWLRSRTTTS
jgi:excisionase family DNA binding protein